MNTPLRPQPHPLAIQVRNYTAVVREIQRLIYVDIHSTHNSRTTRDLADISLLPQKQSTRLNAAMVNKATMFPSRN